VFFSRAKEVAEVPVQERRRSIRHTTVMQVAKIRLGSGREELCLLRDISPEGLKAELYVHAEAGVHIEIELRTGHVMGGRIAWAEAGQIGVSFDEPMPMAAMMAHCSFDDRMGKLRPPRINVEMRGLLKLGIEERAVRIGNISQAGVQIDIAQPLQAGSPCAIGMPGLPLRSATIRWWRDDQAGLLLAEPLDYPEFAEWRSLVVG
jgi:hypothetical protein